MAFHGVIAYEIIINAGYIILNGIYCNNGNATPFDAPNEVNNEIAKRKIDRNAADMLEGEYQLRYIDHNLTNGTLKIEVRNQAYYFEWFTKEKKKGRFVIYRLGYLVRTKPLSGILRKSYP